MISLFASKAASLVLQIVIVVAAVLVFSYFDPFGFLAKKKQTLMNTPIQVNSIKEIGELITAEYYGEVIASLDEVVKVDQDSIIEEFKVTTEDLHQEFIYAIDSLALVKLKRRKRAYDSLYAMFPELVNDPMFGTYLYYIDRKMKDKDYKEKELDKALSEGASRTLIRNLYVDSEARTKLVGIETTEFQTVKRQRIEKRDKKNYKRSRLVIVGRGSVKAGFDFGDFSEKNFRYLEQTNSIHFIGLQPQILTATINPWFIPQEGVEGFEFLIVEKNARMNPDYTRQVKQRCLDKLVFQATDKNILERAQENAEVNLKAFFSLLFEEGKEISKVTFHTDLLEYTLMAINEDSIISNEETVTIDNTLLQYYKKNKDNKDCFVRIADFINQLDTTVRINDSVYELNSFSGLLFHMVRNGVIDSASFKRMEERDKDTLLDYCWQSPSFVKEKKFNIRKDVKEMKELVSRGEKKDLALFVKQLEVLCKKMDYQYDAEYFDSKTFGSPFFRNERLDFEPFNTIRREVVVEEPAAPPQ